MAGTVKGITIEFNGNTTNLSKAITTVRKETKDLDKELGYINNSLKFNPTSVTLWSQKQKVLSEQVSQTEKNLSSLKTAQSNLDAQGVDNNSAQYRELEREIVKCESKLKEYKKELNSIPSAKLKALGEGFKKVGESMVKAGKTLSTKVTAPIVAAYTASAKLGSDYEENLNKIDVAFGKSAPIVKEWADEARDNFGLSKVDATGAVSAFGALGKGIGLADDEAADISTSLTGLSADLGSYFNTGTDESAKALEGIFTGESEALKKFGVVMTDTNLQQFAKDQGLVWKEMSQAEKVTLRYKYVLEKTKDAQGDFKRTSDGTANSSKIFQAAIKDLGTAIGTQLLPIITPIIQKVASFITKLADLPEPVQKIITIVGIVVAALGPALVLIGSIASGIGTVIAIVPKLVAGFKLFAGVLAGPWGIAIAAAIAAGVLLYKNWDTIKAKAKEVKDWVVKKWTELKTSVSTLMTNIKTAVTTAWDTLKTSVSNTVTAIKTAVTTAWNNIKTSVSTTVENIKTAVSTKWEALKTAVSTKVESLKTSLATKWDAIKTKASNTIETAKESVKGKIEAMKESVKSKIDALKDSVKSKFDTIKDKITGPIETAKDKIQTIIDKIKTIFSGLKLELPRFKLPHFKVDGGKAPWGIGGAGKAPSFDIQWYKTGGIFDSPSLIGVGEAGPEAVLPIEKLKEWMQPNGIVINVYGSDGMDVNELASAVERKLVNSVLRKRNAWG